MRTINRALARDLAEAVDAVERACWRNALLALVACDDPAAVYVEGWTICPPGNVIEHGWVEIGDQIVDPTLWQLDSLSPIDYWPGARYDKPTIAAILDASPLGLDLPIVWGKGKGAKGYRYGWGGCDHPGYRQARNDAYREARMWGDAMDNHVPASERVGEG